MTAPSRSKVLRYCYLDLNFDWIMDDVDIGTDHLFTAGVLNRVDSVPIIIFGRIWFIPPAIWISLVILAVNYDYKHSLEVMSVGGTIGLVITLVFWIFSSTWVRNLFMFGMMKMFLVSRPKTLDSESFLSFISRTCREDSIISPKYISNPSFKRLIGCFPDPEGAYAKL